MADLVRYYLEQSVPELEDLQERGIFEKNELTMIMRRRTDFEHRIHGRGSQARDFTRYSEFEMNLEKLRKLRMKRLQSVRMVDKRTTLSDHAGIRRIMFIYERATKRFPADLQLWGDYLKYAKEFGAVTVVYKVYSRLLQLQPRNIDAWLSAAKYEFEENMNATGARVLFQRGLRLNPESLDLWLGYAQFELTYISKLLARRKVLGLITEKQQLDQMTYEKGQVQKTIQKSAALDEDFKDNEDKILLPSGAKDELNHLPEADMNMLGNPESNPALKGDVFLTVFDVCIPSVLKSLPKDATTTVNKEDKVFQVVNKFLQVVDKFPDLNRDYLNYHVLNYVQESYGSELRTLLIDITLPIRIVNIQDAKLSSNLQIAVNKFIAYKAKLKDVKQKEELTEMFVSILENQFLSVAEDKEVQFLLKAIIRKCRE